MKYLNNKLTAIFSFIVIAMAAVFVGFLVGPRIHRVIPGSGSASSSTSSPKSGEVEEMDEDDLEKIDDLDEDVINVLALGVDNTQRLTDVIMYVRLNPKDTSVSILRLPRDCFVGPEYPTAKINTIYGHPDEGKDGITTLMDYLEENWKLEIDYYAAITLDGVRQIVDDMGGVTMDIPQTINYLPGKVLYPGEQVLNGEQAEWLIRYRSGYANGDLGRIDMQSQFLMACLQTAKDLGRMKCLPILMKNYDVMETDMPLNKMISIADTFFNIDPNDIDMNVVPGNGAMYYSYAVYNVDKEGLLDIINEKFCPSTGSLTLSDLSGIPQTGSSGSYGGSTSGNTSSDNETQEGSEDTWQEGGEFGDTNGETGSQDNWENNFEDGSSFTEEEEQGEGIVIRPNKDSQQSDEQNQEDEETSSTPSGAVRRKDESSSDRQPITSDNYTVNNGSYSYYE